MLAFWLSYFFHVFLNDWERRHRTCVHKVLFCINVLNFMVASFMEGGWLLVCAWYYGLSELMLDVTGNCYLMVQKLGIHTDIKYIAISEVKQ